MKKITIFTEWITLAAFLKFAGAVRSGGEAKVRILEGEILVNGEVCTMRGRKLRGGDIVTVDGESYEVAGPCC